MKFTKTLTIALSIATMVITTAAYATCNDNDCREWVEPESVIFGQNNADISAINNAGSLEVKEVGGDFKALAAGVVMTVPANCGDCPGGIEVVGINNGNINAVNNLGDATAQGPLNASATAIGVAILGGNK